MAEQGLLYTTEELKKIAIDHGNGRPGCEDFRLLVCETTTYLEVECLTSDGRHGIKIVPIGIGHPD